jgi:hypothetical protein
MFTNNPINADQISSNESGQSYPTLSTILFPDIENDKTSISIDSDAQATDSFTINNLSKASWATSKILEAEARIAQRTELAKDFKNRIDLWLSSANQQDNNSISYLSFLLEPYVKNEVSKLHNSKTLSLPTGIASLRKLPDHIEITDPTAALAFCETQHPQAVIIKKELNKSILKDLILKQAEPIPGVSAELGPDKLYIKPLKIGEPIITPQIAA